jgi:hypothetical protein
VGTGQGVSRFAAEGEKSSPDSADMPLIPQVAVIFPLNLR